MSNLVVYCEDEEGKNYPLQTVADAAGKILNQSAPLAIEVAFVGEDEIRALNRDKRGKDAVTDVLSFPYYDGIRRKTIYINDYAGDVDEEEMTALAEKIMSAAGIERKL